MIRVHSEARVRPHVEVVERKGAGHPDTLADSIAERASSLYSKYVYQHFGQRFAHHWFDKVVLVGGESRIEYGVGEILVPYKVIFFGKAARRVGSVSIPLTEIFQQACNEVCSEVLIDFDGSTHVVVEDRVSDYRGPGQKSRRYRPESQEDLVALGQPQRSNDCNLCVGYAPLSPLEGVVLGLEQYLNSTEFRNMFGNCTGADIKLVGERMGDVYRLLVNIPFLAKAIHSWEHYLHKVAEVEELISDKVRTDFGVELGELAVNPEKRNLRPYLTVLGSVADTGDVGVVGRGNRFNGLITPTRGMSIEAWAGKNPIDHTGKLYTLLADRLAAEIFETLDIGVEVILTSSKEAPVERPDLVAVNLDGADEVTVAVKRKIGEIVESCLGELNNLTLQCVFGEGVGAEAMAA